MQFPFRKHLDRSIGARLAAIVVVSVLSAVLVGALASAWRDADRRFRSVRVELDSIAAAISASVARPLAAGSRSDVAQTLVAIRQMPGLSFAQVTDAEGKLVAQLGDSTVLGSSGQRVEPNSEISPFAPLVMRNYVLEVPIIHGGTVIGALRIIADISRLRGAIIESLKAALAAGLIATGLAFVVAMRLQRSITAPIIELTEAMESVRRSQDYSRCVTSRSQDETGVMVDAFNTMLYEIQERDQQLADHRDRLEVEVEERTRELKAAKIAAEQANAAKSDFLATMSHEIRTPLNGMLVMAELIAIGNLPPRLQRHADVIVSSGQSLIAIINDILDLSKIEAGRLELEEVPVSPASIAEQVVNLFSARAASKGLDLVCRIGADVPEKVLADPVRLNQVLSNLVNNALKFTEKGHVTLSVACAGSGAIGSKVRLRYAVGDSGIGIPEDKLATIFDPFSQADQSTTRKFGGTGIGLTISRRLVGAMGGALEVASVVGLGSTFHFTAENTVVETARLTASDERMAGHVRILVSQPASRAALIDAVEELGYEALAGDASAAERVAEGARVVALIAEPAAIRSETLSGADRPFIAVIGTIGDTVASALVDEGQADTVLLRPILPSEVRGVLEEARSWDPARPRIDARRSVEAGPELASFEGLSVLAADDNPVNREVVNEALSRLGVKVTLVEDGPAVVEAARQCRFGLIFMDCSMPGMDGYEATRAIRAEETKAGLVPVPIIALTAHVAGSDADAWQKAGMNDYMTKPFTLKSMAACLNRWAGEHRALPGAMAPCDGAHLEERVGAVLNRTVLDDIRAMQSPGDDLLGRIIDLFRKHGPDVLERLKALVEAGDVDETAATAHALKSLCRNIGAERLGDRLGIIEGEARAGKPPCTAATIDGLAGELALVMAQLDELERDEERDRAAQKRWAS